jgi:hypothetical protein
MSLSGEKRDRLLIYLNEYLDGMHKASTLDERVTGQRIDRALGVCKSKPEDLRAPHLHRCVVSMTLPARSRPH